MPRRRVVKAPEPEPSPASPVPTLPPTNSQERFDLDDVSGSEGSPDSDHGRDEGVNNPDVIPKRREKGSGPDIKYFFDNSGEKVICKECE